MPELTSREIHLKNRPQGVPTVDDFELVETKVPEPSEGEVRVRNLWMSVDPYMRGRMYDRPSYVPPFHPRAEADPLEHPSQDQRREGHRDDHDAYGRQAENRCRPCRASQEPHQEEERGHPRRVEQGAEAR